MNIIKEENYIGINKWNDNKINTEKVYQHWINFYMKNSIDENRIRIDSDINYTLKYNLYGITYTERYEKEKTYLIIDGDKLCGLFCIDIDGIHNLIFSPESNWYNNIKTIIDFAKRGKIKFIQHSDYFVIDGTNTTKIFYKFVNVMNEQPYFNKVIKDFSGITVNSVKDNSKKLHIIRYKTLNLSFNNKLSLKFVGYSSVENNKIKILEHSSNFNMYSVNLTPHKTSSLINTYLYINLETPIYFQDICDNIHLEIWITYNGVETKANNDSILNLELHSMLEEDFHFELSTIYLNKFRLTKNSKTGEYNDNHKILYSYIENNLKEEIIYKKDLTNIYNIIDFDKVINNTKLDLNENLDMSSLFEEL